MIGRTEFPDHLEDDEDHKSALMDLIVESELGECHPAIAVPCTVSLLPAAAVYHTVVCPTTVVRPVAATSPLIAHASTVGEYTDDVIKESRRKQLFAMKIKDLVELATHNKISDEKLEEAEERSSPLDPMDDLLTLPMGKYFQKLEKSGDFGKLPTMARCYVGANLSEGFCERIISAGNQVCRIC